MKEINHKLRLKQQSNCYLVVFPSNLLFASLLWLTFLCFSYNQVLLGFILTYTETFLLFLKIPSMFLLSFDFTGLSIFQKLMTPFYVSLEKS